MITIKEYIFFSILSYCNFTEKEYGKTLYEIFNSKRINEILVDSFEILHQQHKKILLNYFNYCLEKWKVFYIDNRTAISKDTSGSGFYSIVFERDGKYVIAYRGSEKYPLEDAYKDFIETDLVIGIGDIPRQFYEGYEVYTTLIEKYNINKEDIYITGHSLGGGIAQYVGLSSDKFLNYIPDIYTWNAVGINRKGIITLFEFFDLDEILFKYMDLNKEEIEYFKTFKISYLDFLSKELKRVKAIKDNVTLLDKNKLKLVIDEEFIKRLLKSTNIEACLMKFSLERRREILVDQKLFKNIFQFKEFPELIIRAGQFINKIDKNEEYSERIKNFGHSGDLTNSLFKHLGSLYLVDKSFEKTKTKDFSFFSNLKLLKKSLQDLHFEDVFLAFISDDDKNYGNFDKLLNLNFIASYGRKVITREYALTNDFLVKYYTMEKVNSNNFLILKSVLIKGFKNCGLNILYQNKIIEQIKQMEIEEFKKLWEKMKSKLASPYIPLDIFDIFIFKK